MLEKTFDPKSTEPRLYASWEASGAFAPSDNPGAEPFSIVMPPPNVTGSLHIGHALNSTLQDVLIRFERMRGKAALWLPGTDHAGIATQMVVERQLAQDGNINRREMGRAAFLAKVWEWKAESGGKIVHQLRKLGASCDWSRERFTLDDGFSQGVRKAFVTLYNEGLIYRDKRLVNWDPHFQTAISDLEVEQREVDGQLWHFAYPLADRSGEIVVATTRPETMLGDAAVAVYPDDERYKHLVGKQVILPIVERMIPIVADAYADPEKGSGAVKITPAHHFDDFQVGTRHDLPMINIFDEFARINENAPQAYRGLDRFAARKKVVEAVQDLGLLRGTETVRHVVPHGDRSGVVVEPFLTDQWFVNAEVLAQAAIKAVVEGDTVFLPKQWEKTYLDWMRNIQPWTISRQLWWGHRVPAWFGPDGVIFVEETEDGARDQARAHYGRDVPLAQDEDVLDTWFSSALWPFSTLGWPENTTDLERFFPTNTLITGFDIIPFWVARMMMQGLQLMGRVPFKRVFINALVRDASGAKMSKSKGNVLDPLALVDEFGADALRFTLTAMSGAARDIKLSRQRVEGYRNLGTKLWNATRFAQLNDCAREAGFSPDRTMMPLNRWIIGEMVRTAKTVTIALADCGFAEAADMLYRFIWNVFCDWYIEMIKPTLSGADIAARDEARAVTAWVLDITFKLLHPVMPFLTEELWAKTSDLGAPREQQDFLMTASWPQLAESLIDPAADVEIGLIIDAISEGRSVRQELNVPPSARPPLLVVDASERQRRTLKASAPLVAQLLRVSDVRFVSVVPAGAVSYVIAGATLALPVAEFIELTAERARLAKEIGNLGAEAEKLFRKLSNEDFVARAPEQVVEDSRERLAETKIAKSKLEAALARLLAVLH
ncbi:valine--tRNA ligase [Bradyrhizobium sp. NBAIM08]|uniref:valine--tRNA ligase n=1 Tax=Bradyrhizobium sp. NBAIM08 TaxID=2793815 RepID=UPI001CD53D6D|nr:valine--tRNA ligase [Bradyrhizobium sp. NBAIM08]MCA1476783.1 valine--tRNA ligase [Bradyrhizobium sp. NBAIM08]